MSVPSITDLSFPSLISATSRGLAGTFGDDDAPSTLLGVAVLGYADQLVEIEATAFVAPR